VEMKKIVLGLSLLMTITGFSQKESNSGIEQ
jgi:hypothetical protein